MKYFLIISSALVCYALADSLFYPDPPPCARHVSLSYEVSQVETTVKAMTFDSYFGYERRRDVEGDAVTETLVRCDIYDSEGNCLKASSYDADLDCFMNVSYGTPSFTYLSSNSFYYTTEEPSLCPDGTEGCTKYCSANACYIVKDGYVVKYRGTVYNYHFDDKPSLSDFAFKLCNGTTFEAPTYSACYQSSFRSTVDCPFHVRKGERDIKGMVNDGSNGFLLVSSDDGKYFMRSDLEYSCTYMREGSCQRSSGYMCFYEFLPQTISYYEKRSVPCPNQTEGCTEYCVQNRCVTADSRRRIVRNTQGEVTTYLDDLPSLEDFVVNDCNGNPVPAPAYSVCSETPSIFDPETPQCSFHIELWSNGVKIADVKMMGGGFCLRISFVNGSDVLINKASNNCYYNTSDNNGCGSDTAYNCANVYEPLVLPSSSFRYFTKESAPCLDESEGCFQYCLLQDCYLVDAKKRIVKHGDREYKYLVDVPSLDDFAGTDCDGQPIPAPTSRSCTPTFEPENPSNCSFHIQGRSEGEVVVDIQGRMNNNGMSYLHTIIKEPNSSAVNETIIRGDLRNNDNMCLTMKRNSSDSDDSSSSSQSCFSYSYARCDEPFGILRNFNYISSNSHACLDQSEGCVEYCNDADECVLVDAQGHYVSLHGLDLTFVDDEDYPTLEDVTLCNDTIIKAPEYDVCSLSVFNASALGCAYHVIVNSPEKGRLDIKGLVDNKDFGYILQTNLDSGEYELSRSDLEGTKGYCYILYRGNEDYACKETIEPCKDYREFFLSSFEYHFIEDPVQCPNQADGCRKFCYSRKRCIVVDALDRIVMNDAGAVIEYMNDIPTLDDFTGIDCNHTVVPAPSESVCPFSVPSGSVIASSIPNLYLSAATSAIVSIFALTLALTGLVL